MVDDFVITRKLFTRQTLSGNGIGTILAPMIAYLQLASLNENLDKIEQFSEDRPSQLVLASNISLLVGSLVESVGFSYALFQKGSFRPNFPANPLIRLGGMIGAFASILDGIGAGISGFESREQGDDLSAGFYAVSGTATFSGGVILVYFSYAGNFMFLGPMGIGLALVIIGGMLLVAGDKARTTAIEFWLRRCCFGKPKETDTPWLIDKEEDLTEAMNAYQFIISGMRAELNLERIWGDKDGMNVDTNDYYTVGYGASAQLSPVGYRLNLTAFFPSFDSKDSQVKITIIARSKKGDKSENLEQSDIVALPDLAENDKKGKTIKYTWGLDNDISKITINMTYEPKPDVSISLSSTYTTRELLGSPKAITY